MQRFYYMTSSSTGVKTTSANSFWGAWAGVKSWYGSNATIVVWDENDNIRIFHGGYNNE